jgi:flagellar motor switch protein FliN/FliY
MNATAENPANMNLVLDVPVSLTIELGGCQLPMREVLQLSIGSVVQLDKAADAPVELSINGKLIARGEVVIIEDRYGVKITEVVGRTIAA